jgi:tetraacyldisaccharide 4'-kinase
MNRFFQIVLFPASLCYGWIMLIRNMMFRFGLLPVRSFPVPVIGVGNLSTGGTGKTPQIEYLIRLLTPGYFVATLSRGYGRKTTGFLEASSESTADSVGDEPLQFYLKFSDIIVSVDEKRTRGIRNLMTRVPAPDIILLDDAFQHQYVKPGLSILLTDYRSLYYEDWILPSGNLREFSGGARRADIIVVTKTPKVFSPITRKRILEEMNPGPGQQVFFSFIRYGDLFPVFSDMTAIPGKVISILMFTGIGNDYPLREHLERQCSDLSVIRFRDHHHYSEGDIQRIIKTFEDLPTQRKIMVTTEKDFMRLKSTPYASYFKNLPLFCIPIEVDFHGSDKSAFDEAILTYVAKDN